MQRLVFPEQALPKPGDRPLRASHPTLIAAHRAVLATRETMLARWLEWLGERVTGTAMAPRDLVEAEFRLILDVFATMVGPLRRETRTIWKQVTELYGRHAADRGLAAGEVVEEMQYLRELLIRHLAPAIAEMRPRQGMALLLRLNRLVDRGVAMAVVGYTDAMVATLLPNGDDHRPTGGDGPAAVRGRLDAIRHELATIDQPHLTV